MIQVPIGILTSAGIFFITSDLIKLPYIKTSRAINNLYKRQSKKTSCIQLWSQDFSLLISKCIKLNEYKRMQLASDLQSANISITPELHIAKAFINAGACGLLAVPAFFIFPLVVPIVIALAFAIYFKESKGIQDKIKARRTAIEYEMPRLVFTIEKSLCHSRDVLAMIDTYRETAGPELKQELSITVADMRSGHYESALTRLESRVGSSMLSDVVRGLISVLRGDNTTVYWGLLSVKFADIQRQLLKQQAQKVPSKVRRLSMALLICFVAMYLIIIITDIMSSMGALFA